MTESQVFLINNGGEAFFLLSLFVHSFSMANFSAYFDGLANKSLDRRRNVCKSLILRRWMIRFRTSGDSINF